MLKMEILKEKATTILHSTNGAVFILYLLIFISIILFILDITFNVGIISQNLINILTFMTVSLTAIYVIKYWEEAQRTKEEIITQSRINFQSVKSSQLPLIVAELKRRKNDNQQNQPLYDIFLKNKGNGPAFRIIFRREIDPKRNQKMAIHQNGKNNQELRTLIERVSILGTDETVKIWTERSYSYQRMKMTIRYSDLFGDWHDIIFEGDRDGIELKEYPMLLNFYDQKAWPKPKPVDIVTTP